MESSLVVQGIAFNQKVLGSNPLGALAELETRTCHNAPGNPIVKNWSNLE